MEPFAQTVDAFDEGGADFGIPRLSRHSLPTLDKIFERRDDTPNGRDPLLGERLGDISGLLSKIELILSVHDVVKLNEL